MKVYCIVRMKPTGWLGGEKPQILNLDKAFLDGAEGSFHPVFQSYDAAVETMMALKERLENKEGLQVIEADLSRA